MWRHRVSNRERIIDATGYLACRRQNRSVDFEQCLSCPWFRQLGESNGMRFVQCDYHPLKRLYPAGI